MAATFIALLGELLRKSTGVPPDVAALARASTALEKVGMPEDRNIPSYFFDAIRRVVAGDTLPWVSLPPHEQGLGWVLGKLTEVVPGSWLDELPTQDVFGIPSLQRAVVVERNGDDRYAVVELQPSGRPLQPPPRTRPTILGTMTPTEDQLRRWAYDPDLQLASQDVEDILEAVPVSLLVELARDPTAPKRDLIRGAILYNGLMRVRTEGARARPLIDDVAHALRTSGNPALFADGTVVAILARYLDGYGPVSLEDATQIAKILLAGIAEVNIDVQPIEGWWELAIRERPPYERLYVHAATGALAFRRNTWLDADGLRKIGTPPTRIDALGAGGR
jgi:hypothetical protein